MFEKIDGSSDEKIHTLCRATWKLHAIRLLRSASWMRCYCPADPIDNEQLQIGVNGAWEVLGRHRTVEWYCVDTEVQVRCRRWV
jgi:hypothetical protein